MNARRAVLFATVVVGTAALWNPLHLERGPSGPWWDLVTTLVVVIALFAALRACLRPGLLRVAVLLLGVVALYLTWVAALLATGYRIAESPADLAVLATRESSQLVAVEFHEGDTNTVYRVELRRRWGPIRQSSVVWRHHRPPIAADFTETGGVVVTGAGYETPTCDTRYRVEPVTLTATPEARARC